MVNVTEDVVLDTKMHDRTADQIIGVVCQLDKLSSKVTLFTSLGTVINGVSPIRDDLYDETILAQISLRKDATVIISADIMDLRLDQNGDGLMCDGVTQMLTQSIQEQAMNLLNSIRAELNQLNGGTAVMLKVVYDPEDSGIFKKQKWLRVFNGQELLVN